MNRVPLFSPAPALLERARIAGTSHDFDDRTSRNPRDWRARRQARRLRLVVKRSRQTGLYGLLDYASRRTVADSLTIDQLENALALAVGSISYPTGRPL